MFRALRPALLGLAIEQGQGEDTYRVVDTDGPRRVVHSGDLAACEAALLGVLKQRHGTGRANLPFATLGGKQLWGDRVILCGWRVQEHVYTGHCRLLDPADTRRAWGTFEACRTALEAQRQGRGLAPRADHLVVLLHGMGRSKDSFARLAEALQAAGYETADVNYPSTRKTIAEHAAQLAEILAATSGTRRVSFVTHSLGGIIVRALLAAGGDWQGRIEPHRVVMLAPPSQGSIAAEVLRDWLPYQLLMGRVGQQLTPETVGQIPAPSCPFGIIAGGTGQAGLNPLLPGDDDGVVTVRNTRLEGAADFLRIDASHTLIMSKPRTIAAVLAFLATGRFAGSAR